MRGWIVGIVLLGAGCTGMDPVPAVTAEELTGSVGVLHLERDHDPAGPELGRTLLRAAFARYEGVDGQEVMRILRTAAPAGPGDCAWDAAEDGVTDLVSAGSGADVELLDVGALRIRVAETEARLTPRTFPDLASVIAGVFYAGDAELAMPRAERDEYRIEAEGSADVGAFEVVVPAPAAPANLALVGEDGTSARLDEAGGRWTEVSRTGALTVLWDAEDLTDTVEVELTAQGVTLACTAMDEGSLVLDAELLAALPADFDASLTVRRVRTTPFDAPGLGTAYARVGAVGTFALWLVGPAVGEGPADDVEALP
ncbi:MAG: hypothetical protein ACFCGT_23395 [Sandaracinaceae bacterium]